jgi:RsiW-degrading membrane proteinase PrsW (M82 family)
MLGLLLLAIAPAVFLFVYIYSKDRYEPEPLTLVLWVFFLGALTTLPAGLIEYPFPEGVISSALVAPIVEEGLKFLVVWKAVYRRPEFNEPMDGIVYAAAASLGFATVENIFYVLDGGLTVGILRAFLSVPGHVIFSCIWGAALGFAKFRPEAERPKIIITGLLAGMLLHGFFNFSIESFEVLGFLLLILVVIPLGWWLTCRNIRKAHASPASACSALRRAVSGEYLPPEDPGPGDTQRQGGGQYCMNCGAPLREGTQFCENCGTKRT